MKKHNLFKGILLSLIAVFLILGCREDILQEHQQSQEKLISKIVSLDQSRHKTTLISELQEAKDILLRINTNAKGEIINFDEGISINTNQIVYVDGGTGFHTYTFKINHKNAVENEPLENLVLTSLPDGSYREFLISYNLTQQEKQILMNGGNVNVKDKYTITELKKGTFNGNGELTGKIQSCGYVEAQAYTWCSEYVHHNGEPAGTGEGQCNAEVTSHLVTVYLWVCESIDDGQDNGSSGGGYYPIGENGIYTNPFISIGYQYYETEDPFDPDYVLYNNVANYFASLGTEINQLRTTNPDLFYYTFFYFKDNGINTTTKNFITERLIGLNNWYNVANSNPNSSQLENQHFLNWAFKFLVSDNPDISWDVFNDDFFPPQISFDDSFDNTKIQCILQKIVGDTQIDDTLTLPIISSNDNFFQKMIRNFNGIEEPNLNFSIVTSLPNNDWGITNGNNNNYNILISQNIENGSNLMKVITLSHELIHAYMFNHLYSLGIITFDNDGNPILNVQCSTSINYNNINLNQLNEKDRFVALFCAMNQSGSLTPNWTHDLFNTNTFGVSAYRQQLEQYLLNFYNWDSENETFKNEAELIFGITWKNELAKAVSWIGLENTAEYNIYINSYNTSPIKGLYILQIRNKISNLNNSCQ